MKQLSIMRVMTRFEINHRSNNQVHNPRIVKFLYMIQPVAYFVLVHVLFGKEDN